MIITKSTTATTTTTIAKTRTTNKNINNNNNNNINNNHVDRDFTRFQSPSCHDGRRNSPMFPRLREGVGDTVGEDQPARHLVEVDVRVQRQQHVQAELPQLGDGVAQHQNQDEHAREVQALAWSGEGYVM